MPKTQKINKGKKGIKLNYEKKIYKNFYYHHSNNTNYRF